jgi:hypothetical protein
MGTEEIDEPLFQVSPPKHERHADDFYETPIWMTLALLKRVPIAGAVLEPCAGDLAIARVLRAAGLTVFTNDINPHRKTDTHLDVTREWPVGRVPWVASNIPFKHANVIAPRAVENASEGVALILRISFLEPTKKRQDFLLAHPPTRIIVLPRYSFTGNKKTDSVTAAWFVWSRHVQPGIEVVTKHERDALAAMPPNL